MAPSYAVRRQLLEASLPESTEVPSELLGLQRQVATAIPGRANQTHSTTVFTNSGIHGGITWINNGPGTLGAFDLQ